MNKIHSKVQIDSDEEMEKYLDIMSNEMENMHKEFGEIFEKNFKGDKTSEEQVTKYTESEEYKEDMNKINQKYLDKAQEKFNQWKNNLKVK